MEDLLQIAHFSTNCFEGALVNDYLPLLKLMCLLLMFHNDMFTLVYTLSFQLARIKRLKPHDCTSVDHSEH